MDCAVPPPFTQGRHGFGVDYTVLPPLGGIDEVVVSAAIHPLLLEELMKLVEICSAISFFA